MGADIARGTVDTVCSIGAGPLDITRPIIPERFSPKRTNPSQ